ncbi:MAG TPA: ABC transporter ATP-binding protein, partial [Acidisarcina sp.]
LVTHDRYMLDRVSTVVLGLDGLGSAERFADYSQWETWQDEQKRGKAKPMASTGKAAASPAVNSAGKKKLSYIEAREYAAIEEQVSAAEERMDECRAMLEDPAVAIDAKRLQAALVEMDKAQHVLDNLYARWAELEAKQA